MAQYQVVRAEHSTILNDGGPPRAENRTGTRGQGIVQFRTENLGAAQIQCV
jgi:hypothetical protein